MNKIRVNHDKLKVDDIELGHGEVTIGRQNDNDIHFDHPYLSGHHAKIVTLFDASHVEDLDSTNGTYVNGKQVSKHTLHNGDVISFGDYHIIFSSDARQESASTHQETMVMDNDELMKRLKESDSAAQQERPISPDNSVTKSSQKQAAPRPTPSADEIDFLRKMQEKLQKSGHNTENKNVDSNHIQQPKPQSTPEHDEDAFIQKMQAKLKPEKEQATTAKNTQRPVLQASREELFGRKEEKKRLLSPVTVYILTVSTICIVALLLLPYIS